MIDIATAISGISGLIGLTKDAIAARDDAKAQQALIDVQSRLLDVSTAALAMSQANMDLMDQIRSLKDEKKQLEEKTRERTRYTLSEIGFGRYAYKSNLDDQSGEPTHYICQPCYDKGVKSVLRIHQVKGDSYAGPRKVWECPESREHEFSSGQ